MVNGILLKQIDSYLNRDMNFFADLFKITKWDFDNPASPLVYSGE